jgi:hypothetical protein
MPGMKVTLNTAMRVRDVSRPSPQHEDNARAKAAEWPASRARPTPAPPSARDRKGGAAAPRPSRPVTDRGETPASRTGGGPPKGQDRPAPPASQGTAQRPAPVPRDAAQQPREAAPAPQRPPALPPGHGEANGPVPARGKRVRRRRRRGQAGG